MRMNRLLLLALVLVAGCATKPPSSDQIVPAPADRLFSHQVSVGGGSFTVTRDVGSMGGGCPLAVLVAGQVAGEVRTGEQATFHLPAGETIIGVVPAGKGLCSAGDQNRHRNESSLVLKPGEHRRYRAGIDADGSPFLRPTTL